MNYHHYNLSDALKNFLQFNGTHLNWKKVFKSKFSRIETWKLKILHMAQCGAMWFKILVPLGAMWRKLAQNFYQPIWATKKCDATWHHLASSSTTLNHIEPHCAKWRNSYKLCCSTVYTFVIYIYYESPVNLK